MIRKKKLKNLPAVSILCLSITSALTHAANEEFNTDFLHDLTDEVSIEAVKNGYSLAPGLYKFAVILNRENIDNRMLRFYKNAANTVVPCLDQDFLDSYQITFASPEQKQQDAEGCYDLSVIPNSQIDSDISGLKLNLTLPQANVAKVPRGYVSPKLFDEGISAVVLNYSANTNFYKNTQGEDRQNSSVLLNGGFNLGAWRYRNQSSYTQYTGAQQRWQTTSNRLERNIIPLQARLELGDTYTNSDVFDSFNFRGVQLSKELAQLPFALQNYAPVIRGTAFTNALVEIRQNGYLVYSTNVSPGSFVIDDLYAANESGDLDVSIKESDGRIQSFRQAFSSVPNMIRPGQQKYQITAGQYRSGSNDHYHPYFGQISYSRGMSNYFTPFGGAIVAEDYYALASGVAWSMGMWGSLSTDISYAQNTLADGTQKDGASFRFLYAKSLNQLGTNFRLVGYRYSTKGYYSFADSVQEKDQWRGNHYDYQYEDLNQVNNEPLSDAERRRTYRSAEYLNKKNLSQVSINQDFGKWGQLYGNLTKTDYWQKSYDTESWQVGYNNSYHRINYGAYYQMEKSLFAGSNFSTGLTLSFALDQPKSFRTHDVTSNSAYQYSQISGSNIQSSLSGSFLADKNLNLQVQAGHAEKGNDSFGLSGNYRGNKVNANASYTYNDQYQQMGLGLSGGLLIHSGGILFSQQINSNPILVQAQGAQGVRIENQPGVKIDNAGYALISGSSAYMKNRVALRAEDLGQNVSVDHAVINDIVPTKMAIVKVKFDVKTGQSILTNLSFKQKPVVTGSAVIDVETQENMGIVGLNGQAYLTAAHSHQKLRAQWGDESYQQCQFSLPELQSQDFGYAEINVACHALEAN